jgi:uncharacterized protein YbjT (DUF2867 family)
MAMILVTTAGGNVGGELVKALSGRGAEFRCGYHSPEKAEKARATGLNTAVMDYGKAETLRAALQGIDRLFLASPATPAQPEQEAVMVEEARKAGVKRIVKLSVWRAPEESTTFARWNRQGEKKVEASGIPFTLLRPNSFMQNVVNFFSASIRAQNTFFLPGGNARISHIDVRDIASAAAVALTGEGHEGRAYDLSGPEALTYQQIAGLLSRLLGRTITYVNLPEEDFKKTLLGLGAPEWQPAAFIDLMRYSNQGQASDVLGSVQQITGRKPTSFEQFARDHRAAFS